MTQYYLYRVRYLPNGIPEISYRTEKVYLTNEGGSWGLSGSFACESDLLQNFRIRHFISMVVFDMNDFETQVQLSIGSIPSWVEDEVKAHDPNLFRFYLGVS